MKALFAILMIISVVPVSIAGMVWGWGLDAESWGWVAFSYLWVIMGPMIGELIKD